MLTKEKTCYLAKAHIYRRALSVLAAFFLYSPLSLADTPDLVESPLSLSISPSLSVHAQLQATIKQNGTLNKATINQIGDDINLVSLVQLGSNNLADITQAGANNSVNLVQYGDNNFTSIVQQGDANIVNLTQLGEQSLLIHQLGSDMVLNISVTK
ncbi:curlin subunit CsgB [Pseudoalteromonas sp. T1lg23B]|uniref:curlin subunit CsgB n=1 Tax=Pseudoalteromonas sp. T1lg23B TaxID=2077097 RepID=UPI000CF5F404|nr:curlin subunit CsgB [Pseudoalteromonas sp. T1lg23B]